MIKKFGRRSKLSRQSMHIDMRWYHIYIKATLLSGKLFTRPRSQFTCCNPGTRSDELLIGLTLVGVRVWCNCGSAPGG